MSLTPIQGPEQHDTLEGVPSPAATPQLIGHRPQWDELLAARRDGRLHHAWLFQGPRGVGKATAAFAFARALVAPAGGGDAAQSEAIARQIAQDSHPNVLHITRPPADRGSGFKTAITVDEVRRLNRFFHSTTAGGGWRVAIVDPADDMNRNAANALLKILEEPPARSIILITNHAPGRLLPTIRSRCRTLRFAPLDPPDLSRILEGLPLQLAASEIGSAVDLAQGSARKAISFAASGAIEVEARVRALLDHGEPDWHEIQGLADALVLKGRESAYELTIELVLKLVAELAEARLAAGQKPAAARLAAYWQSESERFATAAAYNLDRKQALLTFFLGFFALRSEMGSSAA
ncbi:DNA polymerase III subunit delta' [Consotaella aegiceratis]|uniref:DNA polymerase III subunit delta' n=1 Tax=Consotaella aegiceratis TaxID=3097961 RepID=UPI002F4001B2